MTTGAKSAIPGPRVRTDIVDVYVARRRGRVAEVLQLRRVGPPLAGTWQPVMGHLRRGETAVACMWRELREETGLGRRSSAMVRAWALEGVHPYFMASIDAIVLSPRFAVEVSGDWRPRLNSEHDAFRWVNVRRADRFFMWPGQIAAVRELVASLASPAHVIAPARVTPS